MWKEFKDFALKGNVLDLAVGVIIGGAFGKIVTSLVNDVIMPLVGLVTGNINYSNMFILLDKVPAGAVVTTADDAKNLNIPTLNYGSFITQIIDFAIMAFTIFIFIRMITKLSERAQKVSILAKKKDAAEPTTKQCPYCMSEINILASRCPSCTSILE